MLDCTGMQGTVRAVTGAIVVDSSDGQSVQFPVAELSVVLFGVGVSFTSGVIHRLTAAGISILFCDWKGVPESCAYAWSKHGRVGARHLAQSKVSIPRRKALWAELVRAKIQGQASVLDAAGCQKSRALRRMVREVRSGDPQNLEGQAARAYWGSLFPDEGFTREARSGVGRNACLDYGYMILRGHGIRAVLAAGLDPSIGVFHRGRSNGFNLVDDIIEPFRPAIDNAVLTLSASDSPSNPEVKQLIVAAANGQFDESGSTAPTVLEQLAQSIGKYFEGDIKTVAVPRWRRIAQTEPVRAI